MKVKEKLLKLCKEDSDFDATDPYFDFYCILEGIKNWPEVECYCDEDEEEFAGETEMLDAENWEFTAIGEDYFIVNCGGDWQEPYTVRVELQNDEFVAVSWSKCENFGDNELDIDKELGFFGLSEEI